MGEVNVPSLKATVLPLGCVGFLLANPRIVFQRACVLCPLHISVLCVCMRDVISEFNTEIEGSLVFSALKLFLCSILCLMYSGNSLHVEYILPFQIPCLSVWRMMFDKTVFAVRQSPDVRESSPRVFSELWQLAFSACVDCCDHGKVIRV